MPNSILQWNCRGYKSNLNELHLLIQDHNPGVICLQESLSTGCISLKHYTSYNIPAIATNGKPNGGICLMVKNQIPQREITLDTELQAQAVSVTLQKTITICNLYIPPSLRISSDDINNIIRQLPKP